MKKGQEYIGVVDRVNFPNKGIVRIEGFQEEDQKEEDKEEDKPSLPPVKIVVKDVLPGQMIKFRLTKNASGRKEGRLLKVVTPSEREGRVPPCPHFGSCGGCAYQTMPYKEQLRLKEEQGKQLLQGFLKEETIWEGILGSPREFRYRNKMEYSFGDEVKDGDIMLGMHKKGSFYDVLTTDQCQIVEEDFNRIVNGTLKIAKEFGLTYYHKITHSGYLRHLLVRRAIKTGEILVHLVTTSAWEIMNKKEDEFFSVWKNTLLSTCLDGRIKGIVHTINDRVADVICTDSTKVLFGEDFFFEELLDLKFKISSFSFFQTNSLGAEVLYRKVREYIGGTKDKVIFDLYSGTGTIAQLLAPVAKKVIGVEIVEDAVEAARDNARRNGLLNCEFLAGDVLQVLDTIKEKPDYIVLDPPRDGVHKKALEKIIGYQVERMVYISCKPTSMARDLELLCGAGYKVEKVCMVDMFPETVNVETVVMLSHKKPDSVINVKVEFGEGEGKVPLDNIAKRAAAYKPKERVTYKKIKEYIEAKYGFKVHTAYIAEVKRDLGLPMYDAPNAVEELKQPRKHPTAEKVEAIKDALEFFELI